MANEKRAVTAALHAIADASAQVVEVGKLRDDAAAARRQAEADEQKAAVARSQAAAGEQKANEMEAAIAGRVSDLAEAVSAEVGTPVRMKFYSHGTKLRLAPEAGGEFLVDLDAPYQVDRAKIDELLALMAPPPAEKKTEK